MNEADFLHGYTVRKLIKVSALIYENDHESFHFEANHIYLSQSTQRGDKTNGSGKTKNEGRKATGPSGALMYSDGYLRETCDVPAVIALLS